MVRKNEHMFEKMSLSPLAQELLVYLARSPGGEYYIRELAESLPASVGGSHAALKDLESKGLVRSRKSGRNRYYQVNEDNPSIIQFKVFMNIQELQDLLRTLEDLVLKVVLFGSCSRGDDTHDSDIDLLVMTNAQNEARKILGQARINGREVRPIVLSPHEVLELKEKDPALTEEIGKGILLMRVGDRE